MDWVMDWVRIYLIAMLTIGTICALGAHGEPRGPSDFRHFFASLLLSTPWYGRVFGWW